MPSLLPVMLHAGATRIVVSVETLVSVVTADMGTEEKTSIMMARTISASLRISSQLVS